MALILPRSVFYHIPKTGGTFVRLSLRQAGFCVNLEVGGHNHTYPSQCRIKNRFSFAFVRHPLSWYESYWTYKQYISKWDPRNTVDANTQSEKFSTFIQKMIDTYPGYVSCIYQLYTEIDTPNEINFIGRQENLREDLCHALTEAGENFDKERIHSFPVKNVSPSHPEWDPAQRKKIIELESFAFKRFNYDP